MAKAAPKKTSEPEVKHNWAMAAVWVVGGAILTLGAAAAITAAGSYIGAYWLGLSAAKAVLGSVFVACVTAAVLDYNLHRRYIHPKVLQHAPSLQKRLG